MNFFDISMLVVFLLTDILIVLASMFSYKKNYKYSEGMIMGIHIPFQHAEDPQVVAHCEKSKKNWSIFNWVNLVAGCLVCLLVFIEFEIFMAVWMLWIVEYLALLYYFTLKPYRALYRIKVERGWIDESTKHQVRVDTKVSAASGKMALNWKWHIPILGILAVVMVGAYSETDGFSNGGSELLFMMIAISMSVMFTFFHIGFAGKRNKVYSTNSELNYKANAVIKRSWAWAAIWSDMICSAAAVYVVMSSAESGWTSNTSMIIFTILYAVASIIMVALIINGQSQKKKILENDADVVYVDDDEYWKNGWYSNPHDKSIFIQSRMSSANITLNMAHPVAKAITAVTAVLLIGTVIMTLWVFGALGDVDVKFYAQDDIVSFEAFMYEVSFDADAVESMEIINEMPDEHFSRTNGASTSKVHIGRYRGSETGKTMMFIINDAGPILRIDIGEMVIFANSPEEGAVQMWHDTIEEMR